MATARINDIDLYYEEHGDPAAEPLLLIMGFMMNAAAYAPQIPAFAERYRVIAFDNRGAGRTSQPEAAYTIAQMAGDAAGLLNHLGIGAAHVLAPGHSVRIGSLEVLAFETSHDAAQQSDR